MVVDIGSLPKESEVFVQVELSLLYQLECRLVDFKVVGVNASIVVIFFEFFHVIFFLWVNVMVAKSLSNRLNVRWSWLCDIAPRFIPWLKVGDPPVWVSCLYYVLIVCESELHRLWFLALMNLRIDKKVRVVFDAVEPPKSSE